MQSRFRQQTRSWKRRRRTGRTEPTRRHRDHRDQQRAGQQPPGQTSSLSVWLCCKPRRGGGRWRKATKAGGSVRERELRIDQCDRWSLTPIAGVFCPFVCVTWRCFVLYWSFIFVEPLFKHISDTNWAETGDVRWGWCSDASTLPGAAASFRKFLLFLVHKENLRFQHHRWRHDAAIAMALSFIYVVIFLLVILFSFHFYLWRQSLHVYIFALFLSYFLPVCISLICQY